MEDKDLQKLFQSFQPELSSESRFMSTLLANMKKVEFLRRQQEIERRQNRIAVAIAAVTGFISGVIFMLAMPYISAILASAAKQISPTMHIFASITDILPVLSWIIVGITIVFLSISSYQFTLSLQTSSKKYSQFR